jgi:hypothetical protein
MKKRDPKIFLEDILESIERIEHSGSLSLQGRCQSAKTTTRPPHPPIRFCEWAPHQGIARKSDSL